jgi:hypothetical protein
MGVIRAFLAGAGVAIVQHRFNFRIDKVFISFLGKIKNFILNSFKSK